LIIDLLRWVALLPLVLLPGVWVSHTLGHKFLTALQRLAFALTLSPFVVALQMIVIRAFKIDFASASWVVLGINLPAIVFLLKGGSSIDRLERQSDFCLNILLVGLMFVGGIIYVAYPWFIIDGYREYGYHNLLYIDAVYSLSRAQGIVPEESQMAGYVLAYPWFSQLYTGAVASVTDIAPTVLYCLLNATQLLAMTLCIVATLREELKLRWPVSMLAVALVFWGQNIPGTIGGFFAPGGTFAWAWLLGDMRTGPFLLKFNNANAMPFGLAIMAAVVLLALVARRQTGWQVSLIFGILLTSMGMIYPALLPPVGLLSGLVLLLWFMPLAKESPRASRPQLLCMLLSLLAAAGLSYIYKQIITADLQMSSIWLSSSDRILRKSALFGVSMILPLIPAAIFVIRRLPHREWNTLALFGFVLICFSLNIAFSMGGNIEYKFLYGGSLGLALLAALFVDRYIKFSPMYDVAFACLFTLSLLTLYLKHSYGYRTLVPRYISEGPVLSERSFALALSETESDAQWTNFVRNKTPLDSIVVTKDRRHHVGTYTNRSFYVAQDDEDLRRRIGYAETVLYNLITLRGYPAEEFNRRLQVIELLYGAVSHSDVEFAFNCIKRMGRPVVMHFEKDCVAVQWLHQMHPESLVFDKNGHKVWLLN